MDWKVSTGEVQRLMSWKVDCRSSYSTVLGVNTFARRHRPEIQKTLKEHHNSPCKKIISNVVKLVIFGYFSKSSRRFQYVLALGGGHIFITAQKFPLKQSRLFSRGTFDVRPKLSVCPTTTILQNNLITLVPHLGTTALSEKGNSDTPVFRHPASYHTLNLF
eukprot:scaffold25091_cov147-Cylindrotheca_fusiformis.AAC.8